uniref:DUF732 domain-containing protein n=1 Tax=Rhabditophanes sp. KR3021 TaxID=114890 RepID=A0AC35TYV7_9BILA
MTRPSYDNTIYCWGSLILLVTLLGSLPTASGWTYFVGANSDPEVSGSIAGISANIEGDQYATKQDIEDAYHFCRAVPRLEALNRLTYGKYGPLCKQILELIMESRPSFLFNPRLSSTAPNKSN